MKMRTATRRTTRTSIDNLHEMAAISNRKNAWREAKLNNGEATIIVKTRQH